MRTRDFPPVGEVGGKLMELARALSAKILTNEEPASKVRHG